MKIKIFFLYSICLFCSLLNSVIWEIKQDGTGNFTTIQEGINASTNGDTVLVYPGTYYENINYNSKSITVASLNLTTGNEQYISLTIIDGNFGGSCVRMENVQNGVIHGFTIQHGSGTLEYSLYYYGGGMFIINSNISLNNCTVQYNSAECGGGIIVAFSQVNISKTKIKKNHALIYGGGIGIGVDSYVTFDENDLCDIYLNTAVWANDISFSNLDQDIIVDTFTVIEPEVHFINNYTHTSNYTFSAQNAVIEPIESDLYVAPWGDNNASGLNEDEPLQSIALALIKIRADSLNRRTIHLADGYYSTSLNDQRFPLNLKSYVSLIGESEAGTILDGDGAYGFMAAFDEEKDITLRSFTCQNGYFRDHGVHVWFYEYTTANVENVTIRNCTSSEGIAKALVLSSGGYFKNITIDNIMGGYVLSFWPVDTIAENISVSNVIPNPGNSSGGALLLYDEGLPGLPIIIKNLEVVNNINNEDEWNSSASVVLAYYAEAVFINATIASNNNRPGYGSAITLDSGKLTLINSIVYGNYPHQVRLTSNSVYGPCELTVVNSLIEDGIDGFSIAGDYVLNWLEGNIDSDPLFIDNEEDFHLQDGSPCIGAGIDAVEIDGIWYYAPEYDIEGNPRPDPFDSMPDLGAYENQYGIPQVEITNHQLPINDLYITNYPNPFNPSTTISFSIEQNEQNQQIELSIFNIKGQKVKTLIDAVVSAAEVSCVWNGKDENGKRVSSGEYIARLTINGEEKAVRKMMVVK